MNIEKFEVCNAKHHPAGLLSNTGLVIKEISINISTNPYCLIAEILLP